MRRTLITGGLLAVFAALLAQFGGALGLEEVRSALLGAAIGATLGLVPGAAGSTPRAVGFVLGAALAWAGYALRAGVLPDTGAGRAVAAFLVVAVLTGVSAASLGWVPLWAGLLGVAAIAGAYEYAFGIDPTAFTSQSVTAATTVLLAAAVGFLVGAVGSAFAGDDDGAPALPAPRSAAGDDGLDIVTAPAGTAPASTAPTSTVQIRSTEA